MTKCSKNMSILVSRSKEGYICARGYHCKYIK